MTVPTAAVGSIKPDPTAPAGPSAGPCPPPIRRTSDGDDIGRLAQRAIGGDREAVSELLSAVRPRIVRYCRARLRPEGGGHELADDVAQEVCMALLSALPRYRDIGRPFLAYVHGIAAHKVADARRSLQRSPDPVGTHVFDGPDDVPEPAEHVARVVEAQQARELVNQLPDHLRDVVLLRVAAGWSAEDTGKALDITAGAVRVRQHRALTRLRALAEDAGIG